MKGGDINISSMNAENVVVFKDVRKLFAQDIILNGISFEIRKNECVAIMGPSGSGKTTIAKMINGLINPDSGHVFVNGMKLNQKHIYYIRKQTSFIFQNFNLFIHMNALENIIYTPINVYNKKEELVLKEARFLAEKFRVEHVLEKYPSQLSGGQKQRIAIIRSLILEPDIIIMDEPTASLDPEMTSEVVGMIQEIKRGGITVVIVTHDLHVAKNAADKILFIAEKECQDFLKVDDFFTKDYLKSPHATKFLNGSLAFS
jgi:polar amino acid transport system ATP-binding protein